MAKPPSVTDTLARFVAETDFATISEKALTNAKMHILDTLGAALVGVTTDTAAIAFDYCKRVGHSDEATLLLGNTPKILRAHGSVRQRPVFNLRH